MKIVPCTIRIRDLVAGCRNNEKLLPMTSDGTLMNDYSCGWMDGLTVWQVPFGWNVQNPIAYGDVTPHGPATLKHRVGRATEARSLDWEVCFARRTRQPSPSR